MNTILLTGSAGFIGSRVAELLIDQSNIVGIDNLNDYYDPLLKNHRIRHLKNDKRFIFKNIDISNIEAMNSVFENTSFSAVIHLAGMAGVRYSRINPLVYEKTNVYGTAVILELMRRHNVPKIIFASSSSVYAGNIPPFNEDMRTDYPNSFYAATKKSAEVLIHSYHKLFDISGVVLRYFSVYGPQGRPDMSYFRFIQDIIENRPIHIYGDGTQMRDFTFVDDIVRGTIGALNLKEYEICNLGGSESAHSINELITLIEDGLKKKAKKIYDNPDVSELQITTADTTKAKELLHWKPLIQFENGIEKTIKWHLENQDLIRILRNEKQ